MSWKCVLADQIVRGAEVRVATRSTSSENSMSAQSQPPMKNHQLYSVLWKCSDEPHREIPRQHRPADSRTAREEDGELALQRVRRVHLATLVAEAVAHARAQCPPPTWRPTPAMRPTSSRSDV